MVIIFVKITLCTSLLSLLATILAILIGITQKAWRKRDGILFFNVFAVDVIFSSTTIALCIRIVMLKNGGVVISNLFVFMYLLSWASQSVITINRFVMVSFPFGYKTILTRCRLCVIIIVMNTIAFATMFTSIGLNADESLMTSCHTKNCLSNNVLCELVLPQFSTALVSVIMAFHFIFLLTVYVIECWLWKTVKGHRHRFHSLTSSLNGGKGSTRNSSESVRKGSITQVIKKKISLTSQKAPVRVRGTPVFFMLAHLLTVLPYVTLSILSMSSKDISSHQIFKISCVAVQLLIALRPVINVGNHLSTKSLKRFTKLIQKIIQRDSRELFTEYYYENHKELKTKMLKRREARRSPRE